MSGTSDELQVTASEEELAAKIILLLNPRFAAQLNPHLAYNARSRKKARLELGDRIEGATEEVDGVTAQFVPL
jgi:hypothetical protein